METNIVKVGSREELEIVVRDSEVYKHSERRLGEVWERVSDLKSRGEYVERDLYEEVAIYGQTVRNFHPMTHLYNGKPSTTTMRGNSRITADWRYKENGEFIKVEYYYDATDYSQKQN